MQIKSEWPKENKNEPKIKASEAKDVINIK